MKFAGALQAARPPPSLLLIAKGHCHEFYQKVNRFSEDPDKKKQCSVSLAKLSTLLAPTPTEDKKNPSRATLPLLQFYYYYSYYYTLCIKQLYSYVR